MPIPKPKKGEKRSDFMQRCISDPIMIREYKDTEQRLAVCSTTYNNERTS